TDTTSLNLFKALASALAMQGRAAPARRVIVTERSNFPTDIYMAEGLTRWLDRGYRLRLVDSPDELAAALDEDCALLMLTHVNYRTGWQHDMAALTRHAHDAGALTVWDLAHSAGAVPLDLHGAQADFAVGCTYKYLNGGPGAPAFIWVPERHQSAFRHPLGYAVMQALIARGVIGDYREPEIMRFGFTPLYTRYADVWDAVEILRDILDGGSYDTTAARSFVT